VEWNNLLLFIHLMALVFWLGTDIGVFILGKFAQNSSYGTESRLLMLKVAMILDVFPRISLVFSILSGYQLAVNYGVLQSTESATLLVWSFCSIWLAVVITGILKQNTSIGVKAKSVEKIFLYAILLVMAYLVIDFFVYGQIIQQFWVMAKVLLFGLIIIFMMFLEPAFMPAVISFQRLETEGSTNEIETTIRSSMDKTYLWVIAIYAAVVVSAIFGVWKFI
jgi:hypothetical protein